MQDTSPDRSTVFTIPIGTGVRLSLPHLGLNISERRILIASGDIFFICLALLVTLFFSQRHSLRFVDTVVWLILLSAVWLSVGSLFDIYDLKKAASPIHSLWATMEAVLVAVAVYLLIPFISPGLPNRRLQILIFAAIACIGVTSWRLTYAMVFSQPQFYRSVLVIGAGKAGNALAGAIAENAHRPGNPIRGTGYHIVGFVDDDPEKQDTRIHGIPVVGTGDELPELVERLQPDKIVVAIYRKEGMRAQLTRNIMTCYEQGMQVTTMASLYQRVTERVPIDHASSNLAIVLPTSRSATYRFYLFTKRLFDLACGVTGCIITGVLVPPIWLVSRFTSPGDIFFFQTRTGKSGKSFKIVKFRSMVMDAEKSTGAVWTTEDDPRITLAGKWLRKLRLDELPQSWNILKGDMSLIGPRPERPEFIGTLTEHIPYYGARHAVKPGLTGWAQVKYRYGASEDDARIKLEYDLYYIKNQSMFMDFMIILKTVQVVLGLRGR